MAGRRVWGRWRKLSERSKCFEEDFKGHWLFLAELEQERKDGYFRWKHAWSLGPEVDLGRVSRTGQ